MKKLLVVIDYQNDFVNGALGFPGAEKLDGPICEKISQYRSEPDSDIIFTLDTHGKNYLDTQEGRHLPVEHCLDGQDGWQLYGKIAGLKGEQDLVFSKPTFGSYELGEYLHTHKEDYDSVEFVGVVTDICVISNIAVAKAAMPEVPIIVDASCVASNDPKRQEAALCVMESIHVEIKR